MLWRYTRRESKVLLFATLLTASGYAYLLADTWKAQIQLDYMVAQTVGVFASVAPNEMNERMAALDTREKELGAREAAFLEAYTQSERNRLIITSLIGAALLALILFNFYLDQKRRISLA